MAAREQELDKLVADERRRLEQLAGLTAQEAKAELMQRLEDEAQADAANRIRDIRDTAKRNADREAKKIIALAIQRIAAEQTAETDVSAVSLPNDEMKGRIIGREGRNIRAFELITGVDVIIDDTPDTVVVSCFDPVRREVARLSLEKLVADGRIIRAESKKSSRNPNRKSMRASSTRASARRTRAVCMVCIRS
jgi:ribonuclease Y